MRGALLLLAAWRGGFGSLTPDFSRQCAASLNMREVRDKVPPEGAREVSAGYFFEVNTTELVDLLTRAGAQRPAYVAVLFYADWCSFSQELHLLYSELASLFPALGFASIDAYHHSALNSRMGVRGLPTIVVFASGIDPIAHWVGPVHENSLVTFVHTTTGVALPFVRLGEGVAKPAAVASSIDPTHLSSFVYLHVASSVLLVSGIYLAVLHLVTVRRALPDTLRA